MGWLYTLTTATFIRVPPLQFLIGFSAHFQHCRALPSFVIVIHGLHRLGRVRTVLLPRPNLLVHVCNVAGLWIVIIVYLSACDITAPTLRSGGT